MIKIALRSAALVAALGAVQQVSADAVNPVLDDKFTFKLGYLRNDLAGDITVSRPPLPETPVDLETLGLDKTTNTPWAGFRWRFGERWSLNFSFNRWDSDGLVVITEDFNFDGQEYVAGAELSSKLTADAYVIDVAYAFHKSDRSEAGIGLGIHAFDLSAGLAGSLRLDDEPLVEFESQSDEFLAPVPNLRLYGIYAFTDRISAKADAGWLSASYDDYEGSFSYLSAALEYRFTEHFGGGIGYQYTNVDLKHDQGDKKEEYDFKFDGAQLYLTYSF
ncbi:hypothetical protein EYC98_04570 [Halieaceae bacterium IMCC14734]|uniref:Outer membrane protein beta-barrel domain-containing protein n=1 Tax=Candidatus Litorirhabdus singularis TaxID=2518993 RepID=A0ABT3TCW2_9GAMM|nr:hypothetical protein [Candidatus Litorirhabdus singularis]MCX2980138.1 hypothetical protein [Candidatus Litorirhabdus singularis]